eukprot:scaffold21914_cov68-Phaeocystis_antarctica.AAC.3
MQGDADNRPQAAGGKRSLPQMSVSHLTPKKNARRAAPWLGLEAVPRCRLRVDQGLGSLVGLLQAGVTGKQSGEDEQKMNEAIERDTRVAGRRGYRAKGCERGPVTRNAGTKPHMTAQVVRMPS